MSLLPLRSLCRLALASADLYQLHWFLPCWPFNSHHYDILMALEMLWSRVFSKLLGFLTIVIESFGKSSEVREIIDNSGVWKILPRTFSSNTEYSLKSVFVTHMSSLRKEASRWLQTK